LTRAGNLNTWPYTYQKEQTNRRMIPLSDLALSVVIAAWPDLVGLTECLESLGPQRDATTEVIVVRLVGQPHEQVERFPWVCWSEAAPDRLIPHLWGQGMAGARGGVVAITTSHFRPAADWIAAIRRAHARLAAPAIGGPIEAPTGGALIWATYFLRYSPYLGYRREQTVAEVAGDNASYKRSVLDGSPKLRQDGFWELDVHRRLRAAGEDIVFVPDIRVTLGTSIGFKRFLRQRFRHGQQFGHARFATRSPILRLAAGLASPLIPIVFLSKIVWRVGRSGRDFGPFIRSLPALLCLLLAWSLGEASGYLGFFDSRADRLAPDGS
jgi:hypothetical protein